MLEKEAPWLDALAFLQLASWFIPPFRKGRFYYHDFFRFYGA